MLSKLRLNFKRIIDQMINTPILRVNRFQRINFNRNAGVNIMIEREGRKKVAEEKREKRGGGREREWRKG